MTSRLLSKLIGLSLIAALTAPWTAAGGKKPPTVPERLVSNMIAITQGQTAQINIVNWGDGTVDLEAVLLGDDGKPLLDTTTSILPGQSFSTTFQWPCCGIPRVELRGLVLSNDPSGKTSLDRVIANIEIFDEKVGATSILLPYILLPAIRPSGATE
jgi:hypothetical protein